MNNLEHKVRLAIWLPGLCLVVCAFIVFNLFGNAGRGYIDTSSLFYWWGFQWFNPLSETEHGPFILALSLWIFVRNIKASSGEQTLSRFWLGISLILDAFLIHLLGYLVQQTRISIFGFLIFLTGSAFTLGGSRWGRATIFPCAFMLFSIPLEFLTNAIGFTMRLYVIRCSYFLAQLCGIEIILNGTQLLSADGSYQYDVAPACSGIRSLVALSALSLLMGYLNFRSWWRRLVLLVLSIPFAFIGNVIRIFTIIIAAELFGEKAGTVVHEWFGFIIFIIVLALAMLTVSLLRRCWPEHEVSSPRASSIVPPGNAPHFLFVKAVGIISAVSIATILTLLMTRHFDSLSQGSECGIMLAENEIDPVALPSLLNIDWAGRHYPVSRVERETLPPDTGFSRKSYINLLHPEHEVQLSIVLSSKDQSSIHRPELCLVGQGWTIKDKTFRDFSVPEMKNGLLKTTVLHVERSVNNTSIYNTDDAQVLIPALFAYWFVGADNVVPTQEERLIQMAKDRLFSFHANRWAYVFAQTIALDGEEAAFQRLQEVIELTVPGFQLAGFSREKGAIQ